MRAKSPSYSSSVYLYIEIFCNHSDGSPASEEDNCSHRTRQPNRPIVLDESQVYIQSLISIIHAQSTRIDEQKELLIKIKEQARDGTTSTEETRGTKLAEIAKLAEQHFPPIPVNLGLQSSKLCSKI